MKSIFLITILFVLLSGCSSDQSDAEQGAIEKKTDQVATEMVQKIQEPIDKAKALKDSEEQRTAKFKEQAE